MVIYGAVGEKGSKNTIALVKSEREQTLLPLSGAPEGKPSQKQNPRQHGCDATKNLNFFAHRI